VLLSTAIANPDSTTANTDNAGKIISNFVQEGGNVLNQGLASVQTAGSGTPAPQETTATTAPPAGSGRG